MASKTGKFVVCTAGCLLISAASLWAN